MGYNPIIYFDDYIVPDLASESPFQAGYCFHETCPHIPLSTFFLARKMLHAHLILSSEP